MGLFGWLNQQRRINDLEEQMLKLTRIVGDKDLDWLDMRARCKRLLDRTEKAAARVQSAEVDDQPRDEAAAGTSKGSPGRPDDSPHQIQTQRLRKMAGDADALHLAVL